MKATTLNKLLVTALLSASAIAALPAHAQGPKDSAGAGDKYGYVMRQGKADPFTEGRNVNTARSSFTDGARAQGTRDPYTDGAHGAAALELAGMDRTGVSAPPSHGASAGTDAAA
ncbi:hypothetical protein AB4Z48_19475 [Cupriavidus sp. 2TAF22]|uniref:hypothetical protein n=1 Tax=unclassified Cupriavidus TaxID=2640874 RepID=UPI003F8F238B